MITPEMAIPNKAHSTLCMVTMQIENIFINKICLDFFM